MNRDEDPRISIVISKNMSNNPNGIDEEVQRRPRMSVAGRTEHGILDVEVVSFQTLIEASTRAKWVYEQMHHRRTESFDEEYGILEEQRGTIRLCLSFVLYLTDSGRSIGLTVQQP